MLFCYIRALRVIIMVTCKLFRKLTKHWIDSHLFIQSFKEGAFSVLFQLVLKKQWLHLDAPIPRIICHKFCLLLSVPHYVMHCFQSLLELLTISCANYGCVLLPWCALSWFALVCLMQLINGLVRCIVHRIRKTLACFKTPLQWLLLTLDILVSEHIRTQLP